MFEKLEQLRKLKALQDSLKQEKIVVEKNGTRVVVNGKIEVEEIQINSKLSKEDQEKILKDCINEAMKKIRGSVAQKMSQFGDLFQG